MTSVLASVPSENWDDDFEFQARNTATSAHANRDAHRMSIASSDWDHEDENDHPTISTILEDKKNILHLPTEWIEPGPSTPRRNNPQAENWDDDFEDSPVRRGGKDKSPPRMRRLQTQQPRPESWDEEFEEKAFPSPPRKEKASRRGVREDWNEESEGTPRKAGASSEGQVHDDDPDFGYVERDEEDRTVTARSRRAALSRLGPSGRITPPPPVPALPLPFILPTNTSPTTSPFPRSPTSSVFSVPTTRPPSSSAFTVTSTTHLRRTTSRSSSGLERLPPSPPIHRERERRRLRKKSRPQGPGIELALMGGESGYDTGGDRDEENRPRTPPPILPTQNVPATPSGTSGGALLSRIGSVKKWGVRRKRGSTTPAEVVALGKLESLPQPRRPFDDLNMTPRPHSQASMSSVPSSSGSSNAPRSAHAATNSKRVSSPQGGTWFFRTASSSHGLPRGSASDISLPIQAPQPQTPKKRGEEQASTPSKLMKRKSLGFVQLRLGLGGHGDDLSEKDRQRARELEREKERERYAGLGLGRVGAAEKDKDVFVAEEREGSSKEKDKEKEGSRSFMGSVRRISLANKHKRSKSGISLANVATRLDVVSLGVGLRDETVTPTPKSVAAANAQAEDYGATPTKASQVQSQTPTLLPPIELQPPSPPRVRPSGQREENKSGRPMVVTAESMLSPMSSTSTVSSVASPASPVRRVLGSSPQAASLGRSTIAPPHTVIEGPAPAVIGGGGGAMRRSSLGDLKIPERISQAQVGLRRDMERVREFAAGVEQLKELQITYEGLVGEVQAILDAHAYSHSQQQQRQPRATSPSFFANFPRPTSRNRSNTNPSASTTSLSATQSPPSSAPSSSNTNVTASQLAYKQLASAYYTISSKYRISWECAELLIELGSTSGERGPPTSVSAPVMPTSSMDTGTRRSMGRERAITLGGGEESKPPTPIPGQASSMSTMSSGMSGKSSWRASTGKHDLSYRQLVLLKEILTTGDAAGAAAADERSIPEEAVSVNRDWRWGKDPTSSTITLPSEDSSMMGGDGSGSADPEKEAKLKKKRRASRLGMTGLRDMLRSLKRSQTNVLANPLPLPLPSAALNSSTSLSTTDNSSMDSHRYPHARVAPTQRRRSKTSSGPESASVRVGRPTTPYSPSSLSSKPSPGRPSLASIFRIGQKGKPASPELPPEFREHNHYRQHNQSQTQVHNNASRSRSVSRQESNNTGEEEEDWDRMDDASDMDAAARMLGIDGSATVRGKSRKGRSPYLQDAYAPSLPSLSRPITPKRTASGSQSSIWGGEGSGSGSGTPPMPQHIRSTRLSNVEEHANTGEKSSGTSQPRPSSRGSQFRAAISRPPVMKNGSVRSMPPQSMATALPDPTLAMTPENIRPLLENAREVQARLMECIAEMQALLAAYLHP